MQTVRVNRLVWLVWFTRRTNKCYQDLKLLLTTNEEDGREGLVNADNKYFYKFTLFATLCPVRSGPAESSRVESKGKVKVCCFVQYKQQMGIMNIVYKSMNFMFI